jgi:hypothetical protein
VLHPPTWGVPILVAFYDMHGLQWDYSFPRSPHGENAGVVLQNMQDRFLPNPSSFTIHNHLPIRITYTDKNGKGKVVPVLLAQQDAMKWHWGSGGIAPIIL